MLVLEEERDPSPVSHGVPVELPVCHGLVEKRPGLCELCLPETGNGHGRLVAIFPVLVLCGPGQHCWHALEEES